MTSIFMSCRSAYRPAHWAMCRKMMVVAPTKLGSAGSALGPNENRLAERHTQYTSKDTRAPFDFRLQSAHPVGGNRISLHHHAPPARSG